MRRSMLLQTANRILTQPACRCCGKLSRRSVRWSVALLTAFALILILFVFLQRFPGQTQPVVQHSLLMHQVFFSEMVYENYRPYINSCLTVNPDFTYVLWRNSDAERLLNDHFPSLLLTYRGYQNELQRSDLIRYAALYLYGGVYLDMDVYCQKPLAPLLAKAWQQSAAMLDQERPEQTHIVWGRPFLAMNSAMAAPPRHPFFRLVLESLPDWSGVESIVHSTGPQLLTRKYIEYSLAGRRPLVKLLPFETFSAWMDPNKNWRMLCVRELKRETDETTSTTTPEEVEMDRWRRIGCRQLAAKGWQLNKFSSDQGAESASLGVHRFLHLGYQFAASDRMDRFNLTGAFPGRVAFYDRLAGKEESLWEDG